MDDDALTATLLDIEHRGWDSLCDSTGGDFYGALMVSGALMVLANGAVLDREAVVESLEHAPPWRTYRIEDVQLVRGGADTAALVYRGTGFREGPEPEFVAIMSSAYQVVDGRWRLTLYQQTPIPPAGSPDR